MIDFFTIRLTQKLLEQVKRQDFFTGAYKSVQQTQGISHRAVCHLSQRQNQIFFVLNFFLFEYELELSGDETGVYIVEVESLASGLDGGYDLIRLGCCEYKFDMAGRLFQYFQKRIERLSGEHMHFVYDVYLEPRTSRPKNSVLTQLTNVIDAAVGSAVDLDDIDIFAKIYRDAAIAFTAWLIGWGINR